MTDLIKDLEAVAGLMSGFDRQRFTAELERWFRTRHAEIAEAVKDARRLDWLERNAINITLDGRMHRCMQIGASRISIDVAMHNGAREDGE